MGGRRLSRERPYANAFAWRLWGPPYQWAALSMSIARVGGGPHFGGHPAGGFQRPARVRGRVPFRCAAVVRRARPAHEEGHRRHIPGPDGSPAVKAPASPAGRDGSGRSLSSFGGRCHRDGASLRGRRFGCPGSGRYGTGGGHYGNRTSARRPRGTRQKRKRSAQPACAGTATRRVNVGGPRGSPRPG